MTRNTSKLAGNRAMTILSLTAALFTVATGVARAQAVNLSAGPSLVGTWAVQVTIRDCTTNAPLGPPFNSLVTFHGDETISETAASLAFAPGQRSPGHGTWTRKRGHTYRQEMIALVLFDTEPNLPAHRPSTPPDLFHPGSSPAG